MNNDRFFKQAAPRISLFRTESTATALVYADYETQVLDTFLFVLICIILIVINYFKFLTNVASPLPTRRPAAKRLQKGIALARVIVLD